MASDQSRSKLSTSREIISRILWDSRLNRTAFVVGYQDRLAPEGFREKTVDEWAVASDIPWHRVRFIRCGETRVWDRETHLDLFATDELPAAAWVEPSPQLSTPASSLISEIPSTHPDFACVPRPVFQRAGSTWTQVLSDPPSVLVERLNIITFNILAQLPDDGDLRTPDRTAQLLVLLQSSQADVIALQEVTPTVLAAIQTADWTAGWFLSEPILSPNLDPHGVLVLSRYPFSQVDHWFSLRKRVLIATWTLNDQPWHIAVLHLPSSMTLDAPARRRLYTGKLIEYLSQLPGECAVVGDFNTPGDELDKLFQSEGFDDIWPRLNPNDPGLTYDPVTNDLAAQLSRSGNSSRYDRMWVRSKNWRPTQISKLGVQPVATPSGLLFISDHFGLGAELNRNPEPDALLRLTPPVYTSAIVIIPPLNLWPAIQNIRRTHDRNINRWMPHITLIYGFLPDHLFAEAAELIKRELAHIQPFLIRLTKYESFEHRRNATVWLKPEADPPGALHHLQERLFRLFPQCSEQNSRPNGFTPHLSVGQVDWLSPTQMKLPLWHPCTFEVHSIALISRVGDTPFEVRHDIELGTQGADQSAGESTLRDLVLELAPLLTPEEIIHRETILQLVYQACVEVAGEWATLETVGSARMGVATRSSDIDTVCLIPLELPAGEFLESVASKLSPLAEMTRIVRDAQVSLLKIRLEGVEVDLMPAHRPASLSVTTAIYACYQTEFDPASWQNLVGCFEADDLLKLVTRKVNLTLFQEFLRGVRAWVAQRHIGGNAWGFPGSFSWALMAAWTCLQLKPDIVPDLERLTINFFNQLDEHDWTQPVGLTDSARAFKVRSHRDHLPVITSVAPHQNSARNISRSTAQLIKDEFRRGRECAAGHQWSTLFEPVVRIVSDACLNLQYQIEVVVTSDFDKVAGWLEGRIFGQIVVLEQRCPGVQVRPWPGVTQTNLTGTVTLDLCQSSPADRPAIKEITRTLVQQFQTWADRPDGAKLDVQVNNTNLG